MSIRGVACVWECGNRAAISKGGGRSGNPGFGFARLRRPGISTCCSIPSELALQAQTQAPMKAMPEGIQPAQPHRTVKHHVIAFIQWTQSDQLVGENLAQKCTLAAPLQAALLGDAPHDQIRLILDFGNAWRKRSKTNCCCRGSRAGGHSVACLSVECMRSCRPLSCGEAGRVRSGRMPSLIQRSDKRLKPPGARLAKGVPLS